MSDQINVEFYGNVIYGMSTQFNVFSMETVIQ